mmetsp:Transcript_2208/g.4804  ORF Transcript_2208/g.4804 Transcript_2208/m.4804 type:complete len:284 (+) Transcript_2208:999-1850(+)
MVRIQHRVRVLHNLREPVGPRPERRREHHPRRRVGDHLGPAGQGVARGEGDGGGGVLPRPRADGLFERAGFHHGELRVRRVVGRHHHRFRFGSSLPRWLAIDDSDRDRRRRGRDSHTHDWRDLGIHRRGAVHGTQVSRCLACPGGLRGSVLLGRQTARVSVHRDTLRGRVGERADVPVLRHSALLGMASRRQPRGDRGPRRELPRGHPPGRHRQRVEPPGRGEAVLRTEGARAPQEAEPRSQATADDGPVRVGPERRGGRGEQRRLQALIGKWRLGGRESRRE